MTERNARSYPRSSAGNESGKRKKKSASEAQNNWRRARYDLIVLLDEIYCIVLKDRKRNFICGGLAQLEERVLCKHEVIGSSPIFSTTWADSSVG